MKLDKAEVLRYLGHRGQAYDESLSQKIDACIADCEVLARPKNVYRRFDLLREAEGLRLEGTALLLPGRDIAAHLSAAATCVLLAVTLGVEVEARIRLLEKIDLTAATILDAAAADAVEKACDEACAEIARGAITDGLYPGSRFSPGYGDLPLTLQPDIVAVLDTGRRIGLTVTESLILLPRKSVTAVVGLFTEPPIQRRPGCAGCNLRGSCDFRRCERE